MLILALLIIFIILGLDIHIYTLLLAKLLFSGGLIHLKRFGRLLIEFTLLLSLLILIQSHQWSRFMLFSHHFYCSLGRIEIEFIVLLSFLGCFHLSFVRYLILPLILVWSLVASLWENLSLFHFLGLHPWQKGILLVRRIVCLRCTAFSSSLFLLVEVVDICNTVLHQY